MIARRFFIPSLTAALTVLAASAAASEPVATTTNDAPSEGASEDAPEAKLRPGFGARVGGYGFRAEDGKWTDCRMNGVGIFGTLDLNKHFFLELGLDSYSIVNKEEEHMDRISMLTSVAAGLRMFPDFVITPYIQAGTGAEWTRVTIDGGKTTGVYPIGFLGIGGEVNFTDHFKAGAVLRMLMMAHPNHDEHEHEIVYQHPPETKMEYEPSSQGQFYLRYVL